MEIDKSKFGLTKDKYLVGSTINITEFDDLYNVSYGRSGLAYPCIYEITPILGW